MFYFGGLRSDGSTNVYEYHLPSGLWFIGEQQPTYQGRVQGTYASVWNGSEYLFLGGEMPYQNYSGFQMNECYFGDILLYDTGKCITILLLLSNMVFVTSDLPVHI